MLALAGAEVKNTIHSWLAGGSHLGFLSIHHVRHLLAKVEICNIICLTKITFCLFKKQIVLGVDD